MCWIRIVTKDKLRETLYNQQDRWLDWLWVISKDFIYRVYKSDYTWYKKYIKKNIKWEWLFIMHHRKATIGKIWLENVHPFKWKHFYLMQNWTADTFFYNYKTKYQKETDSETLLHYIEERTSNIYEVPSILEQLSERIVEDLWNIIITNWKTILFYSDWARESYIDIEDNKINWIYSYTPLTKKWFDNRWHMFFDFNWIIEKNTFEKINISKYYFWFTWNQYDKSYTYNRSKTNALYESQYNSDYRYYDVNKYDKIDREYERANQKIIDRLKEKDEANGANGLEEDYEQMIEYLTSMYWDYLEYWLSQEDALEDYLYRYYWYVNSKTKSRLRAVFYKAYKQLFNNI